jgi:hypothetical protein
MNYNKIVFIFLFALTANSADAHNLIKGNVSEAGEKKIPIAGAGVYFPGQMQVPGLIL